MTVSYREAIDDAISKKLLSGLPTTIVMRGYVFKDSGGDPVALTVKSCKVVYDLWDEVFKLTVTQAGGTTSAVAVVRRRPSPARPPAKATHTSGRSKPWDCPHHHVGGMPPAPQFFSA